MNKPDYFHNTKELLLFLKEEGYKISQRTLYRHQKQGLINPGKDGIFSMSSVRKYMRNHLVTEGKIQKEKFENLQEERIKKEIQLRDEEIRIRKLRRLKEEGELISRREVILELCSRAAVFDANIKGAIIRHAGEFVQKVDGDPKKVNEIVTVMMDTIDDALNQFCEIKSFYVLFKTNEIIVETND